MPDAIEHSSLVISMLNLLHLDHLGLLQNFDGIEAVVVLGLHEMDSTKATGAQCALEAEILERVLALGGSGLRLLRTSADRLAALMG